MQDELARVGGAHKRLGTVVAVDARGFRDGAITGSRDSNGAGPPTPEQPPSTACCTGSQPTRASRGRRTGDLGFHSGAATLRRLLMR